MSGLVTLRGRVFKPRRARHRTRLSGTPQRARAPQGPPRAAAAPPPPRRANARQNAPADARSPGKKKKPFSSHCTCRCCALGSKKKEGSACFTRTAHTPANCVHFHLGKGGSRRAVRLRPSRKEGSHLAAAADSKPSKSHVSANVFRRRPRGVARGAMFGVLAVARAALCAAMRSPAAPPAGHPRQPHLPDRSACICT